MNRADILARVSLFSLMKKEDLERIANLAQDHVFHEGEVIIREGERDGRLFIIIHGEVEVVKSLGSINERHLRTLKSPSYFGEMALIDNLVRSASVVAKEMTRLLSINQWNLRQGIAQYPAIALELLQMLSQRIRAIEKSMKDRLGTVLPICANCKKIRGENGSWTAIEEYITDHCEVEFSHGICPECRTKLYPGFCKNE